MKRAIAAYTLTAATLLLSGCYSIRYTPDGERVQESKRILYVFWGATPLGDNTIQSGQPVEEKFTAIDYVINIFTLGIVSGRTVESR